MQAYESGELVGEFNPIFGHAFGKGIARQLGVREVIDLDALAKHLAVCGHATHSVTPKIHAVIAFFAANETRFRGFAFESPVGTGHFEGSVGRF